jgi:3-oxoacyl-[acyl-carrier protein] reductase
VDEITALGRKAVAIKADVAERSDIERMVKIIGQEIGPLDVLVNNAGIHQHLKFWELETQDWDSVMDVNLTAQWLVTKAFVEDMKQRRSGSIINISSIIGLTGTDHEIHYASSKAGVIGMTKSMALELAPFDITVNAIAPGWIETDMTADVKGSEAEDLMMRIPINRVGRPDDIARAVVFLASKDSRWMTGATLHVNGGWGMY